MTSVKESKEEFIALKYNVPICEAEVQEGLSSDELSISGVAISETLTSNGHRFLGDELSEAAQSLNGVKVLKDHENMVDNIVGRVTQATYNVIDKNISFKAKIMDKGIKEMIKDGRLDTVSVGASVKSLEENDDGEFIPRGITFKELSVVAIPADPSASFSIGLKDSLKDNKHINEKVGDAVKEAMETYISQSHLKEKTMKGGLIRMAENDETKDEAVVQPEAEAPKAEAEVAPEESKEESKETETETSESAFERGFKMAMKVKADDEAVAPVEVAKAEAPKEEPKEDEEEATEEVSEGFAVSKLTEGVRGNAMTLIRESY